MDKTFDEVLAKENDKLLKSPKVKSTENIKKMETPNPKAATGDGSIFDAFDEEAGNRYIFIPISIVKSRC